MEECVHPLCQDGPGPHQHLFLTEQCKRNLHTVCKGGNVRMIPVEETEETINKRHRNQLHDLHIRGVNMKDPEYWAVAERQRQDWERFIEIRGTGKEGESGYKKPKPQPPRPKVWTCSCDCHAVPFRSRTVGEWVRRLGRQYGEPRTIYSAFRSYYR